MIHELLSKGPADPMTGKQLAERLGMNIRAVTKAIEAERRSGIPICASMNPSKPGYFLAETEEERNCYCRLLKSRASELFRTRRAILKAELLDDYSERAK